jgi:hypothetical protein
VCSTTSAINVVILFSKLILRPTECNSVVMRIDNKRSLVQLPSAGSENYRLKAFF